MPKRFKGGFAYEEDGSAAAPLSVEKLTKVDTVAIPLPLKSRVNVKPGQRVLRAQALALGRDGKSCTPASVSGTVREIAPRALANGTEALCVIIDADSFAESAPLPVFPRNELPDASTVVSALYAAGLSGKLCRAIKAGNRGLDTVIINAVSCQPFSNTAAALVLSAADDIVNGACVIAQLLSPKTVVISVDAQNRSGAERLRECIKFNGCEIGVSLVPAKYPIGFEKPLVYALTGREIPPGETCESVGCAVFSAEEAANICRALYLGQSASDCLVSVSGKGVGRSSNFIVPKGTAVRDILSAAGGLKDGARLIYGSVMTGSELSCLDAPIAESTALIALDESRPLSFEPTACIRCGRCSNICPMRLMPAYIYKYNKADNKAALEKYHPQDCIGCFSCTYICPARLPLADECIKAGALFGRKERKAK